MMILMMLAKGASIVSIIGGSFLKSELFRYPIQPAKIGARAQIGLGVYFSKTSVLMMLFWGGSRRTQKSPPCRGDLLLEHM